MAPPFPVFGIRTAISPAAGGQCRPELKQWLAPIALKTTDGHAVLVALAEEMRRSRIIIPGISVAERMAAEAMHAADKTAVRLICERVPAEAHTRMDALMSVESLQIAG